MLYLNGFFREAEGLAHAFRAPSDSKRLQKYAFIFKQIPLCAIFSVRTLRFAPASGFSCGCVQVVSGGFRASASAPCGARPDGVCVHGRARLAQNIRGVCAFAPFALPLQRWRGRKGRACRKAAPRVCCDACCSSYKAHSLLYNRRVRQYDGDGASRERDACRRDVS